MGELRRSRDEDSVRSGTHLAPERSISPQPPPSRGSVSTGRSSWFSRRLSPEPPTTSSGAAPQPPPAPLLAQTSSSQTSQQSATTGWAPPPPEKHLAPATVVSAGSRPPSFQDSQRAAAAAAAVAPVPVFRTYFACLTLNMGDKIRLISFTPEDYWAVCDAVKNEWPKGIQWPKGREPPEASSQQPGSRQREPQKYGESFEIKCRGYPWGTNANGDDNARRLFLGIVQTLWDRGWVLQAAIDISKKELDKDSFVFRLQLPPPPICQWIAVSFDWTDKLKVVGDPPLDLMQAIVQAYANLVDTYEIFDTRLKIHFKDKVWWPAGHETVLTRQMLLTLFECLERFGFSVLSSVDMSNSREGHECDVLICNRSRTWVPGAPVWHR